MKRTGLFLAVVATALAATTAMAVARDMVVTRDSDVYRERTGNRVVNDVERGQIVDVRECNRRANRCLVRIPGPDGWVRADRLAELDEWRDDRPGRPGRPGEWRPDDGRPGGGRPGSGGGVTITIPFPPIGGVDGGRPGGGRPGGGGSGGGSGGPGGGGGGQVCLFEHNNYGGASRCFRPGEAINLVDVGWDNVVSSARVSGGARAELCDRAGGGSPCIDVSRDTPSVGSFNDRASYIAVY